MATSTKPYLVRGIYDWCIDNGYTPYLAVAVDGSVKVPMEYVKNGEIVLNISPTATHKLTITNELIQFAARFAGVSREISVPMHAVRGLFARENGEGMFFPAEPAVAGEGAAPAPSPAAESDGDGKPPPPGRPRLQIVK